MAHILLLEPDIALARTYRQALEHAGHSVSVARAAQNALNAAEDHVPDAVVLELQLATHNGIAFLHEFRSYTEWQGVPVIVNTFLQPQAIAGVEEALSRNLGVAAILYKPRTSLTQLVSAVNQQIQAAA